MNRQQNQNEITVIAYTKAVFRKSCMNRRTAILVLLICCFTIGIALYGYTPHLSLSNTKTYIKYQSFNLTDPLATKQQCRFNASYVFFYSPTKDLLYKKYTVKARILLQTRYDGCIGLPGGSVPPGGDMLKSLQRELEEEAHAPRYLTPTWSHYIGSQRNPANGLCIHNFGRLVSTDEFHNLLLGAPKAPSFGQEITGYVIPPLYRVTESSTGLEGMPIFLTNRFVGNAVQQFFQGILHFGIMSEAELENMWRLGSISYSNAATSLAHFYD